MSRGRPRRKSNAAHERAAFVAPSSGAVAGSGASGPLAVGLTKLAGGPATIPVKNICEQVVKGYLFGDLESMEVEIKPKQMGAVGYPMVMAVLSGSDLLGALTSDRKGTANRIKHYWKTYMAQVDGRYGDLAAIAADLCRDGIAHNYLSLPGVAVVRGAPGRHLRRETEGVIFDCLKLSADFRRSYEEYTEPYIEQHMTEAQRRLDQLTHHHAMRAERQLAKLPSERFPVSTSADPAPVTPQNAYSGGTIAASHYVPVDEL